MLRPQPVEVHVTQEDIHQGVCKNPEMCAIALALAHTYKDQIDYVEVENYEHIKMSNDKEDLWYRVHICADDDMRVCKFIEQFDDGKQVEPMSFLIDEIEEF